MNKKDKLYYDLIEAYRHHSTNDTLINTYINKVLKLVKQYLDFDNIKKENQELKSKNESLIELISRQNLSERVLVGKIEQFKKVINILKDELQLDVLNEDEGDYVINVGNHYSKYIKRNIYLLLKEVLENEI